ncbi:hypothetical protein [Clostridium tetani]|uniref:hypothetical protein n=1 Tax=Clostridium tetani TaxID=1513 RepID=UPI0010286C16|nr:hypothetical protein [Clostridium tetani]RXI72140.1 hypothetical protein DP127_07715 [Clostridium tetani]BDR75279.1 hypothetical protein K154306013_09390 [Clostridium tetani]
MDKKININVAYEDTKLNIISLLNTSGLPAVCMRSIANEIKQIVDINTEEIIKKERGEMNE